MQSSEKVVDSQSVIKIICEKKKTLFFPQVPIIHWNLCTKRILTMEFAEGGQVNDRDYMEKHGINVNEVLHAAWPALCSCV